MTFRFYPQLESLDTRLVPDAAQPPTLVPDPPPTDPPQTTPTEPTPPQATTPLPGEPQLADPPKPPVAPPPKDETVMPLPNNGTFNPVAPIGMPQDVLSQINGMKEKIASLEKENAKLGDDLKIAVVATQTQGKVVVRLERDLESLNKQLEDAKRLGRNCSQIEGAIIVTEKYLTSESKEYNKLEAAQGAIQGKMDANDKLILELWARIGKLSAPYLPK
jgi:hypothetical protein